MKIAVVSDSHDNLSKIRGAIDKIKGLAVDFLIHAGDYVAPFSLVPFLDMGIEWRGVLGNNDGERQGLINKSEGRISQEPVLSLELGGRKIVISHRIENIDMNSMGDVDLVIYGHSHKLDLRKDDSFVIVNPGELCGYLSGQSTFAIVDLSDLDVKFIEIT